MSVLGPVAVAGDVGGGPGGLPARRQVATDEPHVDVSVDALPILPLRAAHLEADERDEPCAALAAVGVHLRDETTEQPEWVADLIAPDCRTWVGDGNLVGRLREAGEVEPVPEEVRQSAVPRDEVL